MPLARSPIGGAMLSPLGGLANDCCCTNCCCSIFTVNPRALDEAGYFLDSPTQLHWTMGGSFTGSGVITRTSIVAAGTSCIRYQVNAAPVYVAGCPAQTYLLDIDLRCGGELTGTIGFSLTWNISAGDGGATVDGAAFAGICEPFYMIQTKTVIYIIPSGCDGATSRTAILTITL